MARGITIAVGTAVLLLSGVGAALACDTSSWLLFGGGVQPGEVVPLRGGGFDPGRVVLVWDRSGGRVVGEADVGADGRLTTDVTVPADAAGAHKVIALPQTETRESPAHPHAWTDVFVATAAAQTAAVSAPTDDAGTAAQQRWAAAVGLATVAIALLLVARRRRSRRPEAADPQTLAPRAVEDGRTPCGAEFVDDATLPTASGHDAADDRVLTASR